MTDLPKVDLFDLEALSSDRMPDLPDPFYQEDSEDEVDGEKYVVFQVKDNNYAIPSDRVSEVVRMLPLTELPNLPNWFLGIANLRGDILSVIDLEGLWSKETNEQTQKSKLVVLRPDNAATHIAFRVDRLREIIVLNEDRIEPSDDSNDEHLLGTTRYKSLTVKVLDVPCIMSMLTLR